MEFEEIIKNFSHKDRKIYEEYSQCVTDMEIIEMDYLYLQGYKDCIKLLKIIGML